MVLEPTSDDPALSLTALCSPALSLTVFGPVRGRRGGAEIDLGPPQQRAMLALLLARAGTAVPLTELTAALWPAGPPPSSAGILHRYASKLRQALEPAKPPRAPGRWIARTGGGYRLTAGPGEADVVRFRSLRAGTASIDTLLTAYAIAAQPVAAGADPRVRAHWSLAALAAERTATLLAAADLALAAGQPDRVLPALLAYAAEDPADEAIRIRLRRAAGDEPPMVAPAQLPAGPAEFIGRERELGVLAGDAAPVTVICGVGGVGKSAIALHWAHRLAARHPDGQLFANLDGFDPLREPLAPAEALHGFLEALGVPAPRIAAGLDGRAAQFRRTVAGRRVLIVLDNARDAAGVAPLLPGPGGPTVVVTSRDPLAGLPGRRLLDLGVFAPGEAQRFLAARIGADRVEAEPAAVDTLITRCGGLALALAVVAARAAVNPAFALAALAAEIDAERRLDGFHDDLRATFASSYRVLRPAAARLFRLLAAHPGPDFTVAAAASAAAVEDARELVEQLAAAQLISEHRPGRYTMHDLIRDYARELAEEHAEPAAELRTIDHYLRSSLAAREMFFATLSAVPLPAPVAGVTPETFDDRARATAWYEAERAVLLAAVRAADRAGLDRYTGALSWSIGVFQDLAGHWHDTLVCHRIALRGAERSGLDWWAGNMHRNLGRTLNAFDDPAAAREHNLAALRIFEAVGDTRWTAHSLISVARDLIPDGPEPPSAEVMAEVLALSEQARLLYRQGGHAVDEARVLVHLGWLISRRPGGLEEAAELLRQGLAALGEATEPLLEATLIAYAGHVDAQLGNYRRAVDGFEQADGMFAAIGERFYRAEALSQAGVCRWQLGEEAAARACWATAGEVLDGVVLSVADQLRERLRRFQKDPSAAEVCPIA